MSPLCGRACASSRRGKQAKFTRGLSGNGAPVAAATDLRNGASALASASLIARSRNKRARVVMREIVIVALACFLIGIMASALIVQLVPPEGSSQ